MKAIERVLVIIFLLLLVVKLLYDNVVDSILFIILSSLTIYYYCLGFFLLNSLGFDDIFKKSSYEHISTLRVIGSIGASMFLAFLVFGILFKLMQYEGSVNLMVIGLISVVLVIIISLVKYKIGKDRFYMNVVFKFAHWAVLGAIIYALFF